MTKSLVELIGKGIIEPKQKIEDVQSNLSSHLKEVANWSDTIQFYGMNSPESTDETTIALNLDLLPRKFRSPDNHKTESEEYLLKGFHNYLVIGDPGSGKTTTIKRLARKILFSDQVDGTDLIQYPVVIRLREHEDDNSLFQIIAKKLNLEYQIVKTKIANDLVKEELYIGKYPIENSITDFLDMTKALLLLDGLDEVKHQKREQIEKDIVSLGYKLQSSQIIVTCRAGDYLKNIDRFKIVQLCPLEPSQIKEIASKWIANSSTFFDIVANIPYADLLDRPLFLTQLLFFYKCFGYLPEQPHLVYKKIIWLLLRDWDAQKPIIRSSKYAHFDPDQKIEFLSSLSYHLTCEIQTTVFSNSDLIKAYLQIHNSFNLPKNEASQVASELETHSGIIVETSNENYEFGHLSLQEYLCANYLVREPFAELLGKYLEEYPAPVAITVVLSPNPSKWFSYIILVPDNFSRIGSKSLLIFLKRLDLERPNFQQDPLLGLSFLKIYFEFYKNSEASGIRNVIDKITKSANVKESMANSFLWYGYVREKSNKDYIYLKRRASYNFPAKISTPEGGFLPKPLVKELIKTYNGNLPQISINLLDEELSDIV